MISGHSMQPLFNIVIENCHGMALAITFYMVTPNIQIEFFARGFCVFQMKLVVGQFSYVFAHTRTHSREIISTFSQIRLSQVGLPTMHKMFDCYCFCWHFNEHKSTGRHDGKYRK